MANVLTRINNNQISSAVSGNAALGINAASKVQAYSITSTLLANSLVYGSDLTISGNLTVNGTTTSVDTINTLIKDPIITLADGQTAGTPTVDIGVLGLRGNQNSSFMGWLESPQTFAVLLTNTTSSNTTVNATSYGNFIASNITANADLSVNGNIIGVANFSGNVTAPNFLTPGVLSAAGNVTGGNILTSGLMSAAGNAISGNVLTSGLISATSNITGGNILFGGGIVTGTGNIYGGNIISGNAVIGNINVSGDITVNSLSSNTYVSATGNVTGGNINTVGLITATGNVTGGNVNTAGLITATGNITGGNILTGGLISATSTITSAANITGANLLTAGLVSATGNVTGGNIDTAGLITAAGNITGGNLNTGGSVSAVGNVIANNVNTDNVYSSSSLTLTAASGDLILVSSGNINASNEYINNLRDPVQAQDAATKEYVDNAVSSGIHIHTPVYVETPVALPSATYAQGGTTFTVNQTIAGNTVVFSTAANLQPNDQLWFSNSFEGIVANTAYFVVSTPNTSAAVLSTSYNGAPVTNITSNTGLTQSVRVNSGIGATLTATANGNLTIDGVTVSTTQRVLVYQQANAVQNGVYVVSQAGNISAPWILTRASDAETYVPDSSVGIDEGSYFYVQSGDTGAGESYVMTAPQGPFIIGYDNLTFTQFSASQVYSANTSAGLSLTGTVFSAKVDNNTTAFDGGGNISVKAGANLTTPNIGDATGTSLSLTGNVTGGNVNTAGLITATGNITGGNVNTAGLITATGNVTGGNLLTGGLISATSTITSSANITGANLITAGLITATGNITGGNVNTAGLVTATGNITGGNILTGGLISATSNITGGNILFGSGIVSGTGNIYADNIFANISGNIDAAGNINEVQFNGTGDLLTASAGFTFNPTGNVLTANGNINGANLFTGGAVSATGNVTGANLILTTGIIDGPASGRITINGSDIDTDFAVDGDTLANVFYVDAGTGTVSFGSSTQVTNAIATFNTTTSIKVPAGTTGERPSTGVTGMMRFNSSNNNLEIFDNAAWTAVGVPVFTVISDEQFNGDGANTVFTLTNGNQTTNSCIVSINGVVQIPNLSYAVTGAGGNVLTFTEAPAVGDLIDVRQVTTTTTVTSISNSSGNAVVAVSPTSATTIVTGDLSVTGNVNISGNVATNQINNGTSAVQIPTSGGNVNIDVGAVDNMTVFASSGVFVTGNVSVTGNVTAQDVNSLSDVTLKTNIQPISGIESVLFGLNGYEYDWKNGSGHSYGFLAQEVEKVLPNAVKTGADGLKAINYMMIIPFLVETIKQMGTEIQDLKKTVSSRGKKK